MCTPQLGNTLVETLDVRHSTAQHDDVRIDDIDNRRERTRKPALVIAHNAVLRALYAYFQGVPRERCPYLAIPLHTVIELTPHAYGCHETRMALEPRLLPSEVS